MTFWDTSALLALALDDPRRSFALQTLEADDRMTVWWGASVEYISAIARRERDGSLTAAERGLPRPDGGAVAGVVRGSASAAPGCARSHSLQLAAAIAAADGDPAGVGFVCFDTRLAGAASREGFAILTR